MTGIININKLVGMLGDKNHYSYIRVKNMLQGLRGKSTKRDIQQVRKILQRELQHCDAVLEKLENQIK